MVVSAILDTNILCRGHFCVGADTHVYQKSASFRQVADMSPTCRRHVVGIPSQDHEIAPYPIPVKVSGNPAAVAPPPFIVQIIAVAHNAPHQQRIVVAVLVVALFDVDGYYLLC